MAGADSTIYYQVCSFLSYSRGLSNNRTSGFGECLRHFRSGRCPTSNGIYEKVGSEQNKDGSCTSSSMKRSFPNMTSNNMTRR